MLESHCDDVGRDYASIEKTVSSFLDADGDRAAVIGHLTDLADLGIAHAVVSPRQPWDQATLDWLAAIVPEVHAISVGG